MAYKKNEFDEKMKGLKKSLSRQAFSDRREARKILTPEQFKKAKKAVRSGEAAVRTS